MADWRRPPPTSASDFKFNPDSSFELAKADSNFVSWASSQLQGNSGSPSETSTETSTSSIVVGLKKDGGTKRVFPASTTASTPASTTRSTYEKPPRSLARPMNTNADANLQFDGDSIKRGEAIRSSSPLPAVSLIRRDRPQPPSSSGSISANGHKRTTQSPDTAAEQQFSVGATGSSSVPKKADGADDDDGLFNVDDVSFASPRQTAVASQSASYTKPPLSGTTRTISTKKSDRSTSRTLPYGGDVPVPIGPRQGSVDHADGESVEENEMSTTWKTWLFEYSQDTTMHGISYVTRKTRFILRRLVWFAIFCTALGVTFFYVYSRVAFFFTFTMSVSVEVDYLQRIGFPAVTFCNLNSFGLTSVADNGWYDIVANLYDDGTSTVRPCKNGSEFQCVGSKMCIMKTMRCDLFPDCSDGSDEAGCVPCQLYSMSASAAALERSPYLSSFAGRLYEIQNATFTASSPIYVRRSPSNGSINSGTVWLYYEHSLARWLLADSYMNAATVIFGYSLPVGGQSSSSPPSHSSWMFLAENNTVDGLTFDCTFDFIDLVSTSAANLSASRLLGLRTLHQTTSQRQTDFIKDCQWKGYDCENGSIQQRYTDLGTCYTFNSSNMFVENSGPGSGLSFTANIALYDYTKSTNKGIGIKLLVHDPDDVPKISEKGTSVSPGLRSYISLETTEVSNLPPPWGSCGSTELDFYSSYSVPNCMAECETKHVYDQCKCIDTSMPSNNGIMPVCSVWSYVNCLQPVLDEMRAAGNYCTCPTPCTTINYVPTASFAVVLGPDTTGTVLDDASIALLQDLRMATETRYRVAYDKRSATLRRFHIASQALGRASRFTAGSSVTLRAGYDVVRRHVTQVSADCIRTRDVLSVARAAIAANVVTPLENFRAQFLPTTKTTFYEILDAASDAINRVAYCYSLNCTDAERTSMWIAVSQNNYVVWYAYQSLTTTLNRVYQTFATTLLNSVNSLPSMNQFRLDQTSISPMLPMIGVRCSWCVSTSGTSMLTLVRTRIVERYVGATLTDTIRSAKSSIDNAFSNYLTNVWIANVSATVTLSDINQYNWYMRSAYSQIDSVGGKLNSALKDAYDAIGMVDDLLDLIWTQKCQLELPKQVSELDSSEHMTASLLDQLTWFLDGQRQSIDDNQVDYTAGNNTLLDVAGSIQYDVISSTFVSNKVRLDSYLVERVLLLGLIQGAINRIYYIQLAMLTGSFVANTSAYWREFGMTSVGVVLPSVTVVGGVNVTNEDYSIEPSSGMESRWKSLIADVQTVDVNLQLQLTTLTWAVGYVKSYMTDYISDNELSSLFYTNNFLQVDLFYKELTQSSVTQQAAYTTENLLGEVGGFLGLLLGASVITIFEIIDTFLYFALVKYCPRRRHGNKVASVDSAKKAWSA